MIEFLTLFSVLVAGAQPVAVRVGPRVAAVELRLDGTPVAEISGPPWQATVDFGPDLAPHELEALARDEAGRELGRARRGVNRPAAATGSADEERTPVAVASTSEDGSPRPPTAAEVAGALIVDGRPLAPRAVTAGGAEVVIVRDPASEHALAALVTEMDRRLRAGNVEYRRDVLRLQLPLGPDDRVTLLWTAAAEVPAERPAADFNLFATSPLYRHDEGGLSWLFAHLAPEPLPERIADAVCAAGLRAAASGRPRAVVLVVDPATADGSLYDAATARRFLARLGVPLLVWTAAADPGAAAAVAAVWGEAESAADLDRLAAAVGHLRATLARQAIAWLPGRHPPGSVTIAPGAGVALAGGEVSRGEGGR